MQSRWSVSAAVKFNGFYSGTCLSNGIVAKNHDSQNGWYALGVGDTGGCGAATGIKRASYAIRFSDGSFGTVDGTTNLTTGTWYTLTGTFDGSYLRIYVNGVLDGTSASYATKTVALDTGPLLIGRSNNNDFGYPYYTNGLIDDVRIYNRALSAGEVQKLSNIGSDASLVGHWTFDGKDISGTTALDKSGRGNNGTLVNGPTVTEGKIGQGLAFNGTSQYGRVATFNGAPSSQMTICAWIKKSSSTDKYIFSMNRSPSNFQNQGILQTLGGKLLFWDYSGGIFGFNQTTTGNTSITDDKWHHGCFTKNNTAGMYYVDGVSDGAKTASQNITHGSTDYVIGVNYRDLVAYWDGSLDDVRIYNRALSAGEIRSLYDLGSADKINSSVASPQGTGRLDSGLVGYWKLDDATGTTAADASGNGNTGTVVGTSAWTTGKVNGAFSSTGSNGISLTQDPPIGPVTFSAWIYATNLTTWLQRIVGKQDSGFNSYGYGLSLNNDSLYCQASYDTTAWLTNLRTTITPNEWHLVTCTITGQGANQTGKLYVDGMLKASYTGTASYYYAYANAIGYGPSNGAGAYFQGKIDDVRIYNRALSDDEVRQIYNLGNGVNTGTDTSLVGYWSFNGPDMSGTTAYDRSSRGNNGTLVNGPTVTEGKLGQGLAFNGTNTYVSIPNSTNSAMGANQTLSAWVKFNGYYTGTCLVNGLIDKGDDTIAGFYRLYLADTGGCGAATGTKYFGYAVRFSDGALTGVTGNWLTPTLGQWYHVVATFNGTTLRLYVNGVLDRSQVAPTGKTVGTNTSPLTLGMSNPGLSGFHYWLNGALDDVRIYNRALSATEVLKLYNNGR